MVVRIYLVHFHHHVCEHVTAKRVCVCIYGLAHMVLYTYGYFIPYTRRCPTLLIFQCPWSPDESVLFLLLKVLTTKYTPA